MHSFLVRSGLRFSSLFFAAAAVGCAAPADEQSDTSSDALFGQTIGGGIGGAIGAPPGAPPGPPGPAPTPVPTPTPTPIPTPGPSGGGSQVVFQPGGAYFASVTATGSGCPAGTWDVAISPDGQTFTLLLSAYEAHVGPGQFTDVKDCTLDLELGSLQGRPMVFTVGSFYYQGYVALDRGVTARQGANYSFGPPSPIAPPSLGGPVFDAENDVAGPINQSFLHADTVGIDRWSPCSPVNTLHVKTALTLQNNSSLSGDGYINNTTVDGSLSVAWRLGFTYC